MRFILYFDINKTIMMSDPGASVPMPEMINSIISECVWGTVTPGDAPSWTMSSPTPSKNPLDGEGVSYGEFLENVLCMPKLERKHLKTHFTESGFAGEACREYYLRLMERMDSLPHAQLIMPAFFQLIVELEKRGLDFGIVFRTFGSDSSNVADEFNEFCKGCHPLCRDVDSEGLSTKSIDMDRAIGKITRGGGCDGEPETYSLQMGSFDDKPTVITGGVNIYSHLLFLIFEKNKRALMIQDDYPYWHACGESDSSGKLLLIDPASENETIVQIFFDDNVERDRAHIVDVRTTPDLERVSFKEANDKLFMRVSPFEIITNQDYFIETFDEILYRRNI